MRKYLYNQINFKFAPKELFPSDKAGEPESGRKKTHLEIRSFTPENKIHSVHRNNPKTIQTTPALVIIKTKQIHHH